MTLEVDMMLEIGVFEQEGFGFSTADPCFLGAFAAPRPKFTARELIAGRVALQLAGQPPAAIESAAERAIQGFQANRFILLYDGRQVIDPDESLEATGVNTATFLRLTPLAGG